MFMAQAYVRLVFVLLGCSSYYLFLMNGSAHALFKKRKRKITFIAIKMHIHHSDLLV
jgi:hypothetical protein